MRPKRIVANLRVADVDAAKGFYTDYLGLSTEEFNMGWVARYTSPDTGANLQLVTRDATAPEDSVIPSRRTTSTVLMKKLLNSATRSCTRSRQNYGACAGSWSAHQTATSSTSCVIETDSAAACVAQADRPAGSDYGVG